jgi:hypothetical protein
MISNRLEEIVWSQFGSRNGKLLRRSGIEAGYHFKCRWRVTLAVQVTFEVFVEHGADDLVHRQTTRWGSGMDHSMLQDFRRGENRVSVQSIRKCVA